MINPWELTFTALFFGVAMSIFMIRMQRHRMKQAGIGEKEGGALNVNQYRKVRTVLPPHQLVNALRADEALGAVKFQETEEEVRFDMGVTWWSWGEKLTVKLVEVHAASYEYEIKSIPKIKATLIDYGKNLENVKRVEAVLTQANHGATEEALELEDLRRKEENRRLR